MIPEDPPEAYEDYFMKYYVIYLDYTEYNQFEGSWDTSYNKFATYEEAIGFVNSIKPDELIAGPLTLATS